MNKILRTTNSILLFSIKIQTRDLFRAQRIKKLLLSIWLAIAILLKKKRKTNRKYDKLFIGISDLDSLRLHQLLSTFWNHVPLKVSTNHYYALLKKKISFLLVPTKSGIDLKNLRFECCISSQQCHVTYHRF
jgi:hypothetical protein